MTPASFYMDETGSSFDSLEFLRVNRTGLPPPLAALPDDDEELVAFPLGGVDGDFPEACVFRVLPDRIDVASLFGAFSIMAGPFSGRVLLAAESLDGSRVSHAEISPSTAWADLSGSPVPPDSLKARRTSDGAFEPVCPSSVFFGEDGRRDLVTVFLPGPPESVEKKEGRAVILSKGLRFVMPEGRKSELVLRGLVRWGTPDAHGNFVLSSHPSHPNDGLLASVLRALS